MCFFLKLKYVSLSNISLNYHVLVIAGYSRVPGQGGARGDLFLPRLESANSSVVNRLFDRIVQGARLSQAKSSMETRRGRGHSSSQHQICEVGTPASDSR